ncbi:copper amine oxidase [Radiobacillus kanasensis]|uniref:copper amine oxidase n=1 Tax=Radiobacillus kanasensis TaxID=2844358 RepID=UPI001E2BF6F5|nr:copper amine oxidase [Radiobacillus kanasensis]UFT99051.1 copper amine oxidase [Radiobacillus kanasensis]
MDLKKSLVVIPLSLSLLVPVTNGVVVQAAKDETPTVSTAAVDLRSDLGHLLSEHAYLAIETMRKGAEGAEDFDASATALSKNTEDLSAAIASVYGEEAGNSFKEMWSSHIGYFVDYVKGTANKDEEAKQAALDELAQYRQDFSKFLETATGERLEAGSLAEGLQMHVNQLIGAFDSYVAGDYEKAYEYEREAISHMHMVAKGLSAAIVDQFPDKFNNTKAVTPAGDLRAQLNYLLSEHAGLAVMAMQNGIDGSDDFDASAMALSNNTEDLSNAIASVYGEEAGQQFKEMWSNHVGFFVDYVTATAEEDEAAKEEALNKLNQYRQDFSKFIETATEGEVPASALAEGLQMHVDQLISAFDSYAAGDYTAAYESLRMAYEHMYGSAEALSGGIVAQFPDKFAMEMPSDMPNTGMGGTADQGMNWTWVMLATVLFLSAGGYVLSRRTAKQ